MEPIMSKSDRNAVDKLKSQLADIITPNFTDFDFLRWLQGHEYDYDFIVPNLRHHFNFMRSYEFSKLKPDLVVDHYWPGGLLGLSGKDDNFVYIMCMGTVDGEGILKSVSIYDIMLNRICHIEKVIVKSVRNHEKQTGRQSGIIMIQDLDKATLNATTMSMLAGPFRLYLNAIITHYADLLNMCIIVNAPSFVQILYHIVKPILPERTKKKIIILGSNWKTEILQYVDADVLPVHWGGTFLDENNDPKCQSKIVIPATVPSDMYWSRSENEPTADELTLLIVPAGRVHFVTVIVSNVGDKLWWYFFAHIYFGFGVFYTENEDETDVEKMEMVYPQLRQCYAPSVHPERDEMECKKVGFYKIWFSNESSWITKLRINYKIAVKPKI